MIVPSFVGVQYIFLNELLSFLGFLAGDCLRKTEDLARRCRCDFGWTASKPTTPRRWPRLGLGPMALVVWSSPNWTKDHSTIRNRMTRQARATAGSWKGMCAVGHELRRHRPSWAEGENMHFAWTAKCPEWLIPNCEKKWKPCFHHINFT